MPYVFTSKSTPNNVLAINGAYSNLFVTAITGITATSPGDGQITLSWSGGAGNNVIYSYALSNNTNPIASIGAITGNGVGTPYSVTLTLTSTNSVTTTVTLTAKVLGGSTSAVSNSVTTGAQAVITDINGTSIAYPYTYPVPSTNYGNNWINSSLPSALNYNGVACSANGKYVAVAQNAVGIWISNDNGVTFTKNYSTTVNYNSNNITMSLSGKYIIANGSNGLHYSSDYGVSFTLNTTYPNANLLYQIFNETYLFIKMGNTLYYSSNSGSTFNTTSQFGTTTVATADISYTGAIQLVVVGTTIYVSRDYGSTWTTYASGFLSNSKARISGDGKYILFIGEYTSGINALCVGTWNGSSYSWVITNSIVPDISLSSIKMSFDGKIMSTVVAGTLSSTILVMIVSNDYGINI